MHHYEHALIGEALVGEGPEVAHIDLVIGKRGSSVEQAFVNALASPTRGHTPLLAVITPNLPVRPPTLIVNKVTIRRAAQAALIFGAGQSAVAKAVADSVAEGIISREEADNLLIIASVFIEWDAEDKKKIYDWNYEATRIAIRRAMTGRPGIDEILERKDTARHPLA